ncbi:MAG: hypothetical protein JJU00_14970 [Opitutales bacterium]|nr:hypothetical protein [Opitutales bacterium]
MVRNAAVLLAGLLLIGGALVSVRWLPAPAVPGAAAEDPTAAVLRGLLGGTRQSVANFLWIRGYLYWEERDTPGMENAKLWALRLTPENKGFWKNTARVLAYDVPHWERRGAGEREPDTALPPAPVRALFLLSVAESVFPDSPDFPVERGLILLNVIGDRRAASNAFREAWERPGAPYYTARVHGELLRAEGKTGAAYRWYRELYPKLSDDNPAAAKPVILRRIRALEDELGVGVDERFVP